jgi:hypothetical protein
MRKTRTPAPEGRTRWRRFGSATAIVTAMAAGLVYLTATGAIAVSLQLSGIPFKLSASNLSGDDFVQYATIDHVTNESSGALLEMAGVPADASQKAGNGEVFDAATVTVLRSAEITDLYQTVCAPIPEPLHTILAKKNLLVTIRAGRSAGEPVTARGLIVDAPLLNARTATFDDIQIGADLGLSLNRDPDGNFAQRATHVSIDDLHQVAIGTSAGQFKLTGLGLTATFTGSCP